MNKGHDKGNPPVADKLLLKDLQPVMASCLSVDPGPDPTWDPDPFPNDDEGSLEGFPQDNGL